MSTPNFQGDPTQRFKTPQRITITIAYTVYEQLIERSSTQGRSISNLAAYLLEQALSSSD
ncbi:ribbon-helix-helix domain-containing protein [Synechococcus sp. BS55D]|uniref:ribbon-helix-helix domain-containing protein n=1 Tax=Synechococcus sp. BS55D TaxID=2055943 RepID=UPI00103BD27D|nr:hypothetical protein [Synechococcus sp. BS55D]TCD57021.1 hypothetical protein CWE16_04275 [Synechococcus sp. BS55D]